MLGFKRGTLELTVGLFVLLGSVFALKLLDNNLLWVGIALGAVIGMRGGALVSHIPGE